jgi:hypothetical protein
MGRWEGNARVGVIHVSHGIRGSNNGLMVRVAKRSWP